ncbi:MAG: BadF/BadG/BcrA/BcrD ATPase family protein [Methyloceanibacter sp.]
MQGNLLGEGWGGPANIHLDLVLAAQSIRAASKAAARVAGLDERSLQRTHAGLGLAGAGIKSACDDLRSKLGPFASVVLETDAYIAWLGAHRAADGGIVILGTGSCGLAVVNGQRITVGGYGPEVSDEAGGQRIGREALRRALWAFDGRVDRTELSAAVLERFEWDPARIVCFASRATPADYAELAPLVLEYASAKDPIAVGIIQEAVDAAARIIERLKDAGSPVITLIGGLAEPLTAWLPSHVRGLLSAAQSDPLDGAILMAHRAFFGLQSVSLRAG